MRYVVLISVILFVSGVQGAIDRKIAPFKKKHDYLTEGVFTGGEGGRGFSLLDVRRHFSKKDNIERVVLELGDEKGQPTDKIGYFQVSVSQKNKRVDIDLSQMRGARVDQAKLAQLFKSSPLIKSAKINYDPEDSGIIIQLQLEAKSAVEVFKVPAKDKSGRVIVDIKKI